MQRRGAVYHGAVCHGWLMGLCFACVSDLFLTMISLRQIIPPSARPIFRQVFRTGRTVAVDDQYEITFSIRQRTLPLQPIFCWLIDGIGFGQHSADGDREVADAGRRTQAVLVRGCRWT